MLIADDLQFEIDRYKRKLLKDFKISTVSAITLEELYAKFDEFFEYIDVIILDGCIPGNDLNTVEFIAHARERGFGGFIIAASSLPAYRTQMLVAGCDYESEKEDAPKKAWELVTNAQ